MPAHLLQALSLVGLGFLTGAYGTLIGAGGGFVLVPALLLLYPHERPEVITSISLAVVFFNALSGTQAYALMRRVDFRSGLLFAPAAIPGAVLGALVTGMLPRHLFDIVFGVLLIVVSIYMLLARRRPPQHRQGAARGITRRLVEADGTVHVYRFNPVLGVVLSFGVGFLSGLLGIGGGIIHVPLLVYVLDFPVHIATATSHFMLAIISLSGTVTHIVTGAFVRGVHRTIYLAIGVLIGAQLGARLSDHVRGPWIIRSLAIALGLVGVRLLLLR